MKNIEKDFQIIQNHLKTTGFIFQGSEMYGGLANTWDYGPLGSMLNNNIKNFWINYFLTKESSNFLIDSKILMNQKVWEASGHVKNFTDLLIENKNNGKRYRADHIISEFDKKLNVEMMSKTEMEEFIKKNIHEYDGVLANWTKIKAFNLMFQTHQGVINEKKTPIYLRPETAQGIFINFKNIQRSMRAKIPFGIGQIGKSFRNEITPSNFIFRTREFEQMELEYFVTPQEAPKTFDYYVKKSWTFLKRLGLKDSSLKLRIHKKEELAHYSQATTDLEFQFPFGWGELMGVANRADFDLATHAKHSGEKLKYLDPISNQKYFPYVVESSIGLDRLALAVIVDAYEIDFNNDKRVVLKLHKDLSPYKIAVLPLNKKVHTKIAKKIFDDLAAQNISVVYDQTGSIGKRYRRQDAIGTPICLTIIDQTQTEKKATIRFRDTMEQKEINLDEILHYL